MSIRDRAPALPLAEAARKAAEEAARKAAVEEAARKAAEEQKAATQKAASDLVTSGRQ